METVSAGKETAQGSLFSRRWPLKEAGVGFWTRNTCLANGHQGCSFPLCDHMKRPGDGRKIITKGKALMNPRK